MKEQGPIEKALATPDVAKLYMNAFQIATNGLDVTVVTQWQDQPIAVIAMPLQLAKTFAQKLADIVSRQEVAFGRLIQTSEEVAQEVKDYEDKMAKEKRD